VSQGLILLEGRKAALFAVLLFCLAFGLGLDGVHPDLIDVLIMTGLEVPSSAPLVFPGGPVVQTTPSTTEEDAAEEEEDPGGKGEPDCITDRSLTAGAVYPGLCQEKERQVEDEGEHSHRCGKAGDAGAATCGGDFSDMCEETEDSRSCGQGECDDVEDEAVCDPFDEDVGDFDLGVISE
jgi:hypothetical protein